jgi:tRNA (guanine37-N1)-methyltransferase
LSGIDLYLALIHHPVVNRKGIEIASALTTIDMHDIARASMTFGVRGFYVVTPLEDQKILAREVIEHWTRGIGGELNPFRRQALELIRIADSFAEAVVRIGQETGKQVNTAATSAADHRGATAIDEYRTTLGRDRAHVIAFGTAWGLSPAFIGGCDCVLEPVKGKNGYNHLSVRSAVSIILDRLVNGRGTN